METLILVLLIVTLIVVIATFLQILKFFNRSSQNEEFKFRLEQLEKSIAKLETVLNENIKDLRNDVNQSFSVNRTELNQSFKNFSELISKSIDQLGNIQKEQFEAFSLRVKELNQLFLERFDTFQNLMKSNKDDTTASLKTFQENFTLNIQNLNDTIRQNMNDLVQKQENLRIETENRLDKIRESVEKRLDNVVQENAKKLEEIRNTVDEKLHNTLEKRLSESFKLVSERLEQVHNGLGEMKSIASEVGDLKKVLTNSKTKGIIGELQLGSILENILSPGQYQKNVKTKANSTEFVEYAIILPGKDDTGKNVYLPIDSKFPSEPYINLINAYEKSDPELIKQATKELHNAIIKSAKDIRDKYVDPPNTTDFGILFLPSESLYAEAVRNFDLIVKLNQEFKIMIAGPSTLTALLNSLQMGFRTLYIEKRSNEVWKILQAVKTEFNKFEDTLKKAKEKIDKAGEELNELMGTRTNKISNKLRNLQELPENEVQKILYETNTGKLDENI